MLSAAVAASTNSSPSPVERMNIHQGRGRTSSLEEEGYFEGRSRQAQKKNSTNGYGTMDSSKPLHSSPERLRSSGDEEDGLGEPSGGEAVDEEEEEDLEEIFTPGVCCYYLPQCNY